MEEKIINSASVNAASEEATELSLMTASNTASATDSEAENEENTVSQGESGKIGNFGTYRVDTVSGRLSMEFKDLSWRGNRKPVSITHSYNNDYENVNTSIDGFEGMKIGKGWRINLMQSMVRKNDTYVYTDGSGAKTVFKPQTCDSGTGTNCEQFEDENGAGYIYNACDGTLKKGDETHTFAGERLVKIEDRHGNTMIIEHDYCGRITAVYDGVGRKFTFSYDESYLSAITAPNGASVRYEYCDCGLCSITYPNGQTVRFTEDSHTHVTVINGYSEIDTRFTLGVTGRVYKIERLINGAYTGRYTDFDYFGNGKMTTVTETEADTNSDAAASGGVYQTIKQHKVYYNEAPEHNYSYYESDGSEKTELDPDGEILSYTDPGMDIGNLKCENLLRNHNFKWGKGTNVDLTNWHHNIEGSGRFIMGDSADGMPGEISVFMRSWNDSDGYRGIWQSHSLEAGDYVFSCYMKLEQTPKHGGQFACIRVNCCGTSKELRLNNRRGEFVRLALPFKVECGCSCEVGIYTYGNMKVKFIAPQLERGTLLSPYNYLTSGNTYRVWGGADMQKLCTVNPTKNKDMRESFTLSCKVKSEWTSLESGCKLTARINYCKSYSADDVEVSPSEFSIPLYPSSAKEYFVLMPFAKDKLRSVDSIEIFASNLNNCNDITIRELQLVRNSLETGLTEKDFTTEYDYEDEDYGEDEAIMTSTADTEEEVESISFSEVTDSFGNPLTYTNFQNGEYGAIYTAHSFENNGNDKHEEVDQRGNVTVYEHDSVTSLPTAVTDRCGNKTEYSYDTSGRTKKIVSPNNATVEYEYDTLDSLTEISRGDGQKYSMSYDSEGNMTGIGVDGHTLVNYTYKSGTERLKSMTYANGAKQTLVYNNKGSVQSETWMKGNIVEAKYRYFYDASQNLVRTLDIMGEKMYNITRVGENVTSIDEYNVTLNGETVTAKTLVGTMHYSFDKDGKQFRKKYVDANGNEQKYLFEYRDENNVATELPTGVISHAKSDHLGRKVFDELQLKSGFMNRRFDYYAGQVTQTHANNGKLTSAPETTLIKTIEFYDGRTISYEYDKEERITKVTDSVEGVTEYTYDELGQLMSEKVNDVTINAMTYDGYGNIRSKNGNTYAYECDCGWRDKLTSVNGNPIIYDANGNPTTYLGHSLAWKKGRQLKSFDGNTYTYNNNGIRTSKSNGCVTHTYTLEGTNIIKETWNGNTLVPLYDLEQNVCGIIFNSTEYYFYKNLQGDVIAITDNTGATVARYVYDAWGVPTITEDNSNCGIAAINPFRYRGYYYDTEIGMYYLQSRYYDPSVSRFVNADEIKYCGIGGTTLSYNFYTYCENIPIICVDICGNILRFFGTICRPTKNKVAETTYATIFSISKFPFYTESKNMRTSLRNMYSDISVKLVNITNFDSLKDSWNSLSNQDIVIINCDASPSSMNGGKQNDIKQLNFKNINYLILLGCNAGHSDFKYSNVAYEFSKKISGCLLASDGTVYSWVFPYFISLADKHWKGYRKNSTRKNDGWVAYKNGVWHKMNTKQITVKSAIKKLKEIHSTEISLPTNNTPNHTPTYYPNYHTI